ncbi:MAG: hypothetical protein ACPGQL_11410, partial [Thermoplasmatota archaeon]
MLRDGSFRRLDDIREVKELRPVVHEITDLGEILVPFGEFAENNANLPHSSWVEEWWRQVAETAGAPTDLDAADGAAMVT